jgi:SAM-dependent methyltransferase
VETQLYFQMAQLEQQHWWFLARRTIVNHLLKKIPLPTPSQILEVGCGTGGNLALLAQYGQVYALELNEVARQFANQSHCAQVVAGALPDHIPFATAQFDLVVLLDVLEHLEADSLSLQALLPVLKNHGWLLITVPALPYLWSQHDDNHHHYRRYWKSQLQETVTNAGYQVITLNYFNFWLFPLILATRYWKRFWRQSADDLVLPPPWLNKLLAKIFASERYFINWLPFPIGVSLVLVAQKNN